MKGGVILFRGAGTDARSYLESDRSRADEYYLEGRVSLAEFSAVDGAGEVVGEGALTPEQYADWVDWVDWVDWINPFTGESMGTPRVPGQGRQGSPRFGEMVVNAPKSLSIAAALHPKVSQALDLAQRDAVAEIRRWLGENSVTRVGPRGKQEVLPVEQLETVSVVHKTSRAGDPHRHIHFQIATRTIAADAGGERGSIASDTIYSHLDALDRLRLLDDSAAWQPNMRSRSRLRTTATRYFVDPSIGTAALHVGSDDLLRDLNAAGFHFEALVVRDLRIYAQALGGRVDTWRDEGGNEVHAIVTLPDGRWAAVEIKMSQSDVDTAAANLIKFTERVDTVHQGEPAALVVVTATGSAGLRSDGVHITPITALAP